MLVWVLMILDAIAFINLSLLQFGFDYSRELLLFSGIYLVGKAIAFRDVMSIIDCVCGVYILLAFLFGLQSFFYWLILIWILYKFVLLLMDFG
jgi:hypothetical protein